MKDADQGVFGFASILKHRHSMQNLSIAVPFVGFLLSQLLSILFALENSNRCDGYDISSKLAVYPTIASTLDNYAAENVNGTSGLIESLSNSTSDGGIVAHPQPTFCQLNTAPFALHKDHIHFH